MPINEREVPVTADLTIHVSRDAPGSLEEGLREYLEWEREQLETRGESVAIAE